MTGLGAPMSLGPPRRICGRLDSSCPVFRAPSVFVSEKIVCSRLRRDAEMPHDFWQYEKFISQFRR
jgi:hypothetical protein